MYKERKYEVIFWPEVILTYKTNKKEERIFRVAYVYFYVFIFVF